jgi:uncharacterized RDD family membrane protein YckC
VNCPACQAGLVAGQERCSSCGASVAPGVEGALARDPARATPPERGKKPPIREIPGLRKRDKNDRSDTHWKDEVRERIQKRKRKAKTGELADELPLFREDVPGREPEAELPAPEPLVEMPAPAPPAAEPEAFGAAASPADSPWGEEPDLPLRPPLSVRLDIPEAIAHDPLAEALERPEEPVAEEAEDDEWRLDLAPPPADLPPVERPAQFAERLEAAVIDLSVLGGLSAVVVYFASRAAHVPISGLLPVWPWLSAYLALLGLSYAAYFTGTTGQTPGKMIFGLRVIAAAGGAPTYPRAFARAAAGAALSVLAGVGVLPLFFDPARRALHDRLFRTRVVKF